MSSLISIFTMNYRVPSTMNFLVICTANATRQKRIQQGTNKIHQRMKMVQI